jgi:HSP20 family protein
MSEITVQKRNAGTVPAARREVDPFRIMRDLLRWDPFREIAPAWPAEGATYAPAFEVKETKDAFVFKADLPGIKEKDLEVTAAGNRLTVAGKRDEEKETKEETYFAYERSYGSFARTFTLPDQADIAHIRAELKDGELTLVVPKIPEAVSKKIPVSTGEKPKT